MRTQRNRLLLVLSLTVLGLPPAVHSTTVRAPAPQSVGPADQAFGDYWYRGQAEITSYALEQARYGEIHDGHAALIYVTEDFSRRKQVKLDRPEAAGADRVKVLKLNFTKKFETGLYPYSMMTSVFSPVDLAADSHALKITTSSQEWCGHTFTQLNRTADGYRVQEFSYFESEGDQTLTLDGAVTEDELWTTVRLDPGSLPTGEVELVPGTMYLRLSHRPYQAERAIARLEPADDGALMVYTLEYPDLGRTLAIRFRGAFPHEVEGWEETYSGLTTRATRIERTMSPYWRQNRVADEPLRRELLGLE